MPPAVAPHARSVYNGVIMKKSLSNVLTLALALFGCVLALALTVEHYRPTTLPCSVHSNGCGTTLSSVYAQVGPIPTALFGFAMYAVVAALCFKRRQQLAIDRQQEEARARAYANAEATEEGAEPSGATLAGHEPVRPAIRGLDLAIWTLAFLAFGISWWLQYTSIWGLHSFCPYCFTSALTVTAIFVLSTRDAWIDGRQLSGEQKLLAGVLGFVVVLLLFIAVPEALDMIAVGRFKQEPVEVKQSLRDIVMRPDMHVMGDPKAKYTLVEFADYFCPHCAQASEHLPDALKTHPDVKLAFRNYVLGLPNPKFAHSDKAAEAAEAAGRQGADKFWKMHDFLFKHQKEMQDLRFNDSDFIGFARNVGLDVDKFQKDVADTALLTRVIKDHDDGDTAGIEMTPTFFLVTPDRITKFVGDEELIKLMNNPNNEAWK
jgi:protein-disulfide isomerase/uncharacterized membrane protein